MDEALQAIRVALIAAQRSGLPQAMLAKLVSDFDDVQHARATRLATGADDLDALKWALMLFLAMMTQATIAAIHIDRPVAGRLSLCLFTLAATAAIWFLALHAEPYVGHAPVQPAAAMLRLAAGSVPGG